MPGRLSFWRKDDVARQDAQAEGLAAAAAFAAAQEDQRRRREAAGAAQNARLGQRERANRPGLGSNTILTGLLGVLGQAEGGAGRRSLLGG